MTSTHHTAPPAARPAADELEPITVEHVKHRSSWPLLAALALAAVVGPATGWLLLAAHLTAAQQVVAAAAIPVGLGLLGVASTLLDRERRQ